MKDKIQDELEKLLPKIKKISKMIVEAEEDWTSNFDRNDPQDLYLRTMFYRINGSLQDGGRLISRILAEVDYEGVLSKLSNGRTDLVVLSLRQVNKLSTYFRNMRMEIDGYILILLTTGKIIVSGMTVNFL